MIPMNDETNAVSFRDVVRLILRGAPFALLVTLVAVGFALFVTQRSDFIYRADVTLVVTQTALRVTNIEIVTAPVVDPGVYRTAIFEGNVLRRALERISETPVSQRDVERAAGSIDIDIEPQSLSSIVRVAVQSTSPDRAADLANAIAEELIVWDYTRAQSRLEQGVAAIERSIAAIDVALTDADAPLTDDRRQALVALRDEQLAGLERTRTATAAAVYVPLVDRLSTAPVPTDPVSPRPALNVAIAVVLGLMVGYGVVLVFAVTDPRVMNRENLERFTALPVLAEYPKTRSGGRPLSDEATSWLHARLTKNRSSTTLVIAITGLRSADDQASVAVGLAEAFARAGDRTLLIDADLRNARTSADFGLGGSQPGGQRDAEKVDGTQQARQPVRVTIDRDRGFDFVPAGTPTARPADRLGRFLERERETWSESYEVVIIETAPVLPYSDALVAASHADAVVLCVRTGISSRGDLQRAVKLLSDQRIPLVGTVLTGSGRSPQSNSAVRRSARSANGE